MFGSLNLRQRASESSSSGGISTSRASSVASGTRGSTVALGNMQMPVSAALDTPDLTTVVLDDLQMPESAALTRQT